MKKLIIIAAICIIVSAPLAGYSLQLPENPVSYEDMTITLVPAMTDAPIKLARFYFYPKVGDTLVYGDLQQVESVWSLTIPNVLLPVGEIVWFAEIITDQDDVVRVPVEGENITELLSDTAPPEVEPVFPEEPILMEGVSQIVIVRANDESDVQLLSASFEGEEVANIEESDGVIRLIITPSSIADRSKLELTVADIHGNESYFTTEYVLQRAEVTEEDSVEGPEPFFAATGDVFLNAGIGYSGNGSIAQSTFDFAIFTGSTHSFEFEYDMGASTLLKAGPLELAIEMQLQDSREILEIIEAVPSALISDFYDIMRLWHPWNFDNEMTFGANDTRSFISGNSYFAGLTLFEDILTYSFGDQSISFSDKTVKDLNFRGTSASISIPILELAVGKGLTQLGTYKEDWPQNFLGFQLGLNFFDYYWLQTNLSLISDFQGRYETLGDAGHVSIETLYDLGAVNPEQNLVLGVGTGINTPWFTLSGDIGVTLYTNDSSNPVAIDAMIADLVSAGFIDQATADSIDPVLTTLESIFAIIPLFDYFPPTLGLAASAVNQDLWGVMYGGKLTIDPLGLEGWFYKTDSSYKSLGASVSTDLLDIGGAGNWEIGDFGIDIGYAFNMNNIPDIVTSEILPLFMSIGGGAVVYTDDDISDITHEATAEFSTPSWGLLGSLGLRYDFEWALTNAAALSLANSTKNTETMAHTGSALWKSGKLELGDFVMSLSGSTSNTYTTYFLKEGAANSDTLWEFSYDVTPKLAISNFTMKPSFSHAWGDTAATDTVFSYGIDFGFPLFFIDKMNIDVEITDTYAGGAAREEFEFEAGLGMKKSFGPFTVNLGIDGGFTNNILDDSKDEISLSWDISGKVDL